MDKDRKIKRPTRNPDGVSVKGCTYIYAPSGQAGEYAPLAINPYRGCGHGCAYCYVPHVIKMPRKDFDAGATPRPNFLNQTPQRRGEVQGAWHNRTGHVQLHHRRLQPVRYVDSLVQPSRF